MSGVKRSALAKTDSQTVTVVSIGMEERELQDLIEAIDELIRRTDLNEIQLEKLRRLRERAVNGPDRGGAAGEGISAA